MLIYPFKNLMKALDVFKKKVHREFILHVVPGSSEFN